MIELIKGEKRNIYMQVTRRKNEPFVIESVNCKVMDNNGNLIESNSGQIDNTLKEVWYFLDTSNQSYIGGRNYTLEFSITIVGMSKLIKGRVIVRLLK